MNEIKKSQFEIEIEEELKREKELGIEHKYAWEKFGTRIAKLED